MDKRAEDRVSRVPETTMLILGSVLVLFIAVLSYLSAHGRSLAAQQANSAERVQQAAAQLLLALDDAETGQRGFILTGKNEYLEPYENAVQSIPGLLETMRGASVAQPIQTNRIHDLDPVIAEKLKELALTINLRRTKGLAAALEVVDSDHGKNLMDNIRARSILITNTAANNATASSERAEVLTQRLAIVSTVGSVCLLVFLVIAAQTIFSGMKRREMLYSQVFEKASQLEVTLTSIGDAVIATDAAARITFINPVAEALTGWTKSEAIGKPAGEVFHIVNETTRQLVESPIDRVFQTGMIVGLANHTVLLPKDGMEIPIDDSGAPIRNEQGEVTGAVLVFRDISERRRLERGLIESNEHLEGFVSMAAHDLRSPLNSIGTMTELLAVRCAPFIGDQEKSIVNHITRGVARMSNLLEGLLAYAKATYPESEDKLSTPLEEALQSAIENLNAEILESGAAITHAALPVVAVSKIHALQLLQNLIGNALKYRGASPPQITILAEWRKPHWIIQVSDNGIGIEPQYTARIFQPFERLHGDRYPGSGIGLATCQKIVAAYHGRIWVESKLGEGSVFFFSLPGSQDEKPHPTHPS